MARKIKVSTADKEALATVKACLDALPDPFPGIPILCRKSGLNGEKLKKGFHLVYGSPPFQYYLLLRIVEAKRLLRDTEKPVYEIALLTGYEYVSSFCTAFKLAESCTPLQYRLVHSPFSQ